RTLQLRENAQPSRRMIIEVEKVALEQVSVIGLQVGAKIFMLICLEAFARLPTERQKPGAIERDVFDPVPQIDSFRRIGEKAVVFIVAEEFVGRPGLTGIGLGTLRATTYEQPEGNEFGRHGGVLRSSSNKTSSGLSCRF